MIAASVGDALSGKITGMIIDENVVETDKLLKDQSYLNNKVLEAYTLIQSQMQGPVVGQQT